MAGNVYQIGDRVRLRAVFDDEDGERADPVTVILKLIPPDGVQTSEQYNVGGSTIVRDSLGVYIRDVDPDTAGRYRYRWEGTLTPQAAAQSWFDVEEMEFT